MVSSVFCYEFTGVVLAGVVFAGTVGGNVRLPPRDARFTNMQPNNRAKRFQINRTRHRF